MQSSILLTVFHAIGTVHIKIKFSESSGYNSGSPIQNCED